MRDQERSTVGEALWEIVAQTCSLIAPRRCACGREGAWLCARCAALLRSRPRRVEQGCDALQLVDAARLREQRRPEGSLPAGVDHRALLPVLALGDYEGDLQRLVLAWKNGGMLHLTGPIAGGLCRAVEELCEHSAPAGLQLVPVPSRWGARLRRGEDHTAELVRALERRGAGRALLLRSSPSTAQAGSGSRERRARRIRLERRAASRAAARGPVVIVDDVVTTGSTLRAMHEALTGAGLQVLGAVVVAASPAPGTPSADRAVEERPGARAWEGRAPADADREAQETFGRTWHACPTRHRRRAPSVEEVRHPAEEP